VSEVGSVLGVRDSIQGRRVLTTEQRTDVRARIAQRLAQAPGLVVLDNCEHLIDAVAELVAFLVSAVPDLHVLTTSRAPLGIAAERVYLLGELYADDAAHLFRERAIAARPNVRLAEPAVASIVRRLDGLPLAIELAAVQVRAMSVEEIDRRLENRFALLRGGDRSAPDRHQTLLAVIDWSWNLLGTRERRALRWLALFNDGFTLAAAETVLAGDAVAAVQGLVGQSLLSVGETPGGVRYRMLETVREFGRMQLVDAGEDGDARAAVRRWAVGYARAHGDQLYSSAQFDAIDALRDEEINLADELRLATADGDRRALVQLLAALGMFWTIRGEHIRLMVLDEAVTDALGDWQPPPDLLDMTSGAIAVVLTNTLIVGGERVGRLQAQLRRLGTEPTTDARVPGLVRALLAFDAVDPGAFRARLEALTDDADRATAVAACHWLSNLRENEGDPAGAIEAAERALTLAGPEDGPWSWAMPHAILAQLSMHQGNRSAAVAHARAALPVLERLGASDDEIQLRSLLVHDAIADGRITDAEAELDLIDTAAGNATVFAGVALRQVCRAELLIAGGDRAGGLAAYRDCAAEMRELAFPGLAPTDMAPWTLLGASLALAAHARYATPADEEHGRALYRACRDGALRALDTPAVDRDYPVIGLLLFALGSWALLRKAASAGDAVRLLVLADRLAYSRQVPTLAWERIAPEAEKAAPGLIAEYQARYAGRRPAALLTECRRAVERLAG